MPELSDHCRREGCTRPRTKYSVFCDEHHEAQLRRFGFSHKPKPRDIEAEIREIRRWCDRYLRHHERKAITSEELCGVLFDQYVHDYTRGSGQWSAALEHLPSSVLRDLLAYAQAHPGPRLFAPLPADPGSRTARETAALAVQADLVARLREKLR